MALACSASRACSTATIRSCSQTSTSSRWSGSCSRSSPISPTPGSIRASTSRRGRCELDDRTTIAVVEPAPPAPLDADVQVKKRGFLSPINRRRWENFKANRRGYWSFRIFLVLFVLSLFAEFIANDKPFYISLEGKSYYPVFV